MKVLLVTAMYPTPENPAFGSFVKTQVGFLREAGVDVEVLVLDGNNRKLIYPKGVVQLRRRLAEHAIDLVHAHYSLVGMVGRMQRRRPLVVTYHGSDLLGSVANDQGDYTWRSKFAVKAGQLLSRVADACIVQSDEMAAMLGHRNNVYRVPCEVDFTRFYPTPRDVARNMLELDPLKKYLLFAARPNNWVKRLSLAREAAARVGSEDPSVELLVVYKERQDRLALYMSACDALVFPSFHEGSPNIVKQAMACNLPIVATDVGDVRKVIGATEWCFVQPASVEAFADALRRILHTCPRTDGRQHISQFEPSVIAGQLIKVYESAVERFWRRRKRRRTTTITTPAWRVSRDASPAASREEIIA